MKKVNSDRYVSSYVIASEYLTEEDIKDIIRINLTGSRIRSCPDKNLNIEYHLARKAVFDAGENPGTLSYSSCRHASDQ